MPNNMKKAGIKYKMGGSKMMKAPNASNYVGNPTGYYADKAAYGREMARRSMQDGGEKVMVSKTKRRAKDDAWVSSDDVKTKMVNKNRAKRMNKRGWKTHQRY